jgi:hypothetical protein
MDVVVMRKGKRQNLGSVRLADGPAPDGKVNVNRIAALESDVAAMKERVAWSERMVKKGYMTAKQAEADRALLQKLELDLEKARKELKAMPPDVKQSIEEWIKPRE